MLRDVAPIVSDRSAQEKGVDVECVDLSCLARQSSEDQPSCTLASYVLLPSEAMVSRACMQVFIFGHYLSCRSGHTCKRHRSKKQKLMRCEIPLRQSPACTEQLGLMPLEEEADSSILNGGYCLEGPTW